jgi:uncharacterized repeat protein (TIGR03803 family)
MKLIMIAAVLILAFSTETKAQIFQELYSFSDGQDGGEPEGALIQGNDGNFYGTTTVGGAWGGGTIFRITPGGMLTTLASFDGTNDGTYPYGALLQAADGNFYGTTLYGPNSQGTVFKMTLDGALTTLGWFMAGYSGPPTGNLLNGDSPNGDLIQGSDGNIYGTTQGGTVFRLVPSGTNWQLQGLGTPPGGNAIPSGGLLQATDGSFYGVTVGSADAPYGTIYQMTPDGTVSTFVTLLGGYDQAVNPVGNLWQATDGSFYGTAQCCGDNGCLFKCTTNGVLTTFPCDYDAGGGLNPPLVQANDGNFYGTSVTGNADDPFYPGSKGWMFEMSPEGVYTPILSFTAANPPYLGADPLTGLVQGADGNLYGTTSLDGSHGYGNVFRIIMPGPLLSSSQAGSNLILSWRTNYVGYTLQSSLDLTNWSASTNPPAVCGGLYCVTNALTGGAGFFRLIK